MQLSASDLSVVRTRPQTSELFLTVFHPKTVMQCMVTGSISQGARTIPYYNVTTGTVSNIESGMTLLVGTTVGGRELGKIRIRSGTSSSIIVAENGHINWEDAQHLTVLKYWEQWPVYPRIINDPNNDENVIFYKDYDVPYSNQNSILGAFPCAGPHRALFSGEQTYWSATGTSHLLGSALSYSWIFEGGHITGSTSATPGWVRYNTPGDYVTRLVVTGANGSVDTTYRYVMVRDQEPSGVSESLRPIKNWTITNLSGSRTQGGYIATVSIINEDIDIYDGDIIVLWGEDWYGATNQSFGGNENTSKIFFVGYVLDGTIQYNYRDSTISFQVGSVSEVLKNIEGFSVSVESTGAPSKWFELLDMNGQRAIYHYLRWHTTVLSTTDFQFIGTDQNIQFFDSDRESIFDAVDNYMRGTLLGELTANRQGKLFAEVGIPFYSNPTGSFPPVMSIQKDDWMGDPEITQKRLIPSSYIELGGIAYSGVVTGTFTPHIAAAPSQVPNVRGTTERKQGLAISGQAHLNQIVGNYYAEKIYEFPDIQLEWANTYKHLDIAPRDVLEINIQDSDTPSGISLFARYINNDMSWIYNPATKTLLPSSSLHILTNGDEGETITIPQVPEDEGYGDVFGDFNFGRFTGFPPFLSSLAGIQGIWYASNTFLCSTVGLVGTNLISSWTPLTSLNSSFFDGTTILVSGFYFVDVYSRFVESAAGSPQNVNQINFSLISPTIATRRDRIEPATSSSGVEFYLKTNFIAYIPAGTEIQVTLGWNLNSNPSSLSSFVTELTVFQMATG